MGPLSGYACFDQFGEDTRFYGLLTTSGLAKPCRDGVLEVLMDLQKRAAENVRRNGQLPDEELFNAEQNARLVKNAESYYRSMFLEEVSSWNLRDRHMVETLEALATHLDRQVGQSKIAVWAHTSHLGDARATEMGQRGELNIGQLVREKYGRDGVLVGFTTHHGTVTAASDWDGPAERKRVRSALAGSYETTFHSTRMHRFLLTWSDSEATEALRPRRLERAIGVIYRPETERASHCFLTRLPDQFDAVIHFDDLRRSCVPVCALDQEALDAGRSSSRLTSSAIQRGGSSPANASSLAASPGMTTLEPCIMPR